MPISEPSSFRDPNGFVFYDGDRVLRAVHDDYLPHLQQLAESGLQAKLVERGRLIAHEEVEPPGELPDGFNTVLAPTRVPFLSYPHEWCFSGLKDAALATLEIQILALDHGMTLKDASAFNVQFLSGRPVHIDTLSFEKYHAGEPWVAYRQFCQHFLAPLALMARTDVSLGGLFRQHLDGVPLDVATRLLPWRSRFNFGLFTHLYLHANQQRKHSDDGQTGRGKKARVTELGLRGILDSLRSTISRLTYPGNATEWGDYYNHTNYSDAAFEAKGALVREMVAAANPAVVWDLGANEGVFSRIAAESGALTVSFDIDPVAVEKNYLRAREKQEANLLPLMMDLTNPSPAIGWDHDERKSLADRGPADLTMALALIHHLAISNQVPLEKIVAMLARLGRELIIEWVPKTDSQVQVLLSSREDIFADYHLDGFRAALQSQFEIVRDEPIPGTERRLLLARRTRA